MRLLRGFHAMTPAFGYGGVCLVLWGVVPIALFYLVGDWAMAAWFGLAILALLVLIAWDVGA